MKKRKTFLTLAEEEAAEDAKALEKRQKKMVSSIRA